MAQNRETNRKDKTERKRLMSTSPDKHPGPQRRISTANGTKSVKTIASTFGHKQPQKLQDFWRPRSSSTSEVNTENVTQRPFSQNNSKN